MLDHVNKNKQYKPCSGFSLASVQEMQILDLLMVEEFHVPVAVLMENAGAHVVVILASTIHELKEEPRRQFDKLKKTRGMLEIIMIDSSSNLSESINCGDLLIDALLGFNLKGSPENNLLNRTR